MNKAKISSKVLVVGRREHRMWTAKISMKNRTVTGTYWKWEDARDAVCRWMCPPTGVAGEVLSRVGRAPR